MNLIYDYIYLFYFLIIIDYKLELLYILNDILE